MVEPIPELPKPAPGVRSPGVRTPEAGLSKSQPREGMSGDYPSRELFIYLFILTRASGQQCSNMDIYPQMFYAQIDHAAKYVFSRAGRTDRSQIIGRPFIIKYRKE